MRARSDLFSFLSLIASMLNAHSLTAVSASVYICTCHRPTYHIDISTMSVISCSCYNCMTEFSYQWVELCEKAAKQVTAVWDWVSTSVSRCDTTAYFWRGLGTVSDSVCGGQNRCLKPKHDLFSNKTQCFHNSVLSWLTQEQHLSHGCFICYPLSNRIAFDYSWWPTHVYLYQKPNNKNVILNVAMIMLLCWSTETHPRRLPATLLVSGQHKQQGLQGNKRNQIFAAGSVEPAPGLSWPFQKKIFVDKDALLEKQSGCVCLVLLPLLCQLWIQPSTHCS